MRILWANRRNRPKSKERVKSDWDDGEKKKKEIEKKEEWNW